MVTMILEKIFFFLNIQSAILFLKCSKCNSISVFYTTIENNLLRFGENDTVVEMLMKMKEFSCDVCI